MVDYFRKYECPECGGIMDYRMRMQPFQEPPKARMECPLCGVMVEPNITQGRLADATTTRTF